MLRAPFANHYTRNALLAAVLATATSLAAQPFSRANTLLFATDHVVALAAGTRLYYDFERVSSLQGDFRDRITLTILADQADGAKQVATEYLTGSGRRPVPTTDNARGNPVLSLILQRDVDQMAKLSKGPWRHFQQRIKLALAESARITETRFDFAGQSVPGERIVIRPYDDDPQRARFSRFADKAYEFLVSPEVPGFIYRISVVVRDETGVELIEETLTLRRSD